MHSFNCFCSWFFLLVSLSHLCSCVSLCRCFAFLSLWDKSGSFTLLLFWLVSLFPYEPLFFSSFPLLSVRKGSPARVFVWWWDRLCRFRSFFILCLSSSFRVSPPVLSSLLSFLVTFWAEKLEALSLTVYILSNLCWISIQHPFISSCISASKTIATPDKHQTHSSPFRIRLLMSKIRHVGFLTNIPNHHRTEGHSNHLKHQNTIIFPSSIIALCIVLSLFFIWVFLSLYL